MKLTVTKRGWSLAAVLLGASFMSGPAMAGVSDFLGSWVNTDPATTGITRVIVTPQGGNQVRVHVFGQCSPTDCDWGTRPGHSYTESPGSNDVRSIMVDFNAGFANKIMILRRAPGGEMRFEVLTAFNDGSGRNDYDMSGHLAPDSGMGGGGPGGGGGWPPGGGGPGWPPGGIHLPPGGLSLMGPEDCISFNPAAVTAALVSGSWKVIQGSMWMLDYGSNMIGAQRAANVIHNYHFDQQCFVKRPNASMMYWKSGNHVPGGGMPGEDCVGFNPASVSVSFVGGAWKIVDGSHWILDYGSDQAAANQALAVIHNYHLNRQCFVVRPNASMSYWLAQ